MSFRTFEKHICGLLLRQKEDNLAHMKQTRSPWWSLIKTCWHSSEHISLIASKQVSPNSNCTFGLLWATMNMCAFAQIMCTHRLNIANLWQRLRNNVQFAFTATTTTVTNELNNGNNDSWFQCSYLVSTIWENRGKPEQSKWNDSIKKQWLNIYHGVKSHYLALVLMRALMVVFSPWTLCYNH